MNSYDRNEKVIHESDVVGVPGALSIDRTARPDCRLLHEQTSSRDGEEVRVWLLIGCGLLLGGLSWDDLDVGAEVSGLAIKEILRLSIGGGEA